MTLAPPLRRIPGYLPRELERGAQRGMSADFLHTEADFRRPYASRPAIFAPKG